MVISTAQRVQMNIEEARKRAVAEIDLRDALRSALDNANRSGAFAGQDDARSTTIADAKGVYGLVNRALELMGEDVEYWCETNEWPVE